MIDVWADQINNLDQQVVHYSKKMLILVPQMNDFVPWCEVKRDLDNNSASYSHICSFVTLRAHMIVSSEQFRSQFLIAYVPNLAIIILIREHKGEVVHWELT